MSPRLHPVGASLADARAAEGGRRQAAPLLRTSRIARVVVFAAALGLLTAARAQIELIGVLVTPARSSFALSEAPGRPASWHALGDNFAGYSLDAFDAKADTLTLSQPGRVLRVRLKDDAKIKDARIEIAGTLQIGGTEKIEINRATLLLDQENFYPLPGGLIFRVKPTRLPDDTSHYDCAFERPGADGRPEKKSLRVIALPNQPFGIQVGDFGFSFNPLSN